MKRNADREVTMCASAAFFTRPALLFLALSWICATSTWSAGTQGLAGCLGRESVALAKGWRELPPAGDALLALIDHLGSRTLVHYSTREGIQGILDRGIIMPNQKGYSHFTREGLGPREVEARIFLNMPVGRGKGDYVIILKNRPGLELTPGPGKPIELRERGTHRFDPEDVIYAGPNPF